MLPPTAPLPSSPPLSLPHPSGSSTTLESIGGLQGYYHFFRTALSQSTTESASIVPAEQQSATAQAVETATTTAPPPTPPATCPHTQPLPISYLHILSEVKNDQAGSTSQAGDPNFATSSTPSIVHTLPHPDMIEIPETSPLRPLPHLPSSTPPPRFLATGPPVQFSTPTLSHTTSDSDWSFLLRSGWLCLLVWILSFLWSIRQTIGSSFVAAAEITGEPGAPEIRLFEKWTLVQMIRYATSHYACNMCSPSVALLARVISLDEMMCNVHSGPRSSNYFTAPVRAHTTLARRYTYSREGLTYSNWFGWRQVRISRITPKDPCTGVRTWRIE